MHHPSCRTLRIAIVLAVGALLHGAAPAAAGVDLTGTWQVTVAPPGPPQVTLYGHFTQTGPDLSVFFASEPATVLTGTIDPGTGVFALVGPPFTFVDAPPGPDRFFNGVSVDGTSLTGQLNACVYEPGLGWGCVTFDVVGVRGQSGTCGDGVVQASEVCDLGPQNGGNCCSPICTLVDGDGDGVCTGQDNCPTVANPGQDDFDDNGLGDACTLVDIAIRRARITAARGAASIASLAVTGSFAGPLVVPVDVHVLHTTAVFDIHVGAMPAWGAKECIAAGNRIRCRSPDGTLSVVVSRRPSVPGVVKLALRVKHPPGAPPFNAPVSLLVESATGASAGSIDTCTFTASGSIRCR